MDLNERCFAGKLKLLTLVRVLAAFLLCFLCGPTVFAAGFSQDQRHVLVLNSYHKGMLWVDSINRGIEANLPFDPLRLLHFEFLDAKRHPEPEFREALKEFLQKKYQNVGISVIIASDDIAFKFAMKNRSEIFSNAPVVFCGVNYYDPSEFGGIRNYTGVVERNDYLRTIKMAFSLHPNAKKLYIANDSSTTGQANRAALNKLLPELDENIEVRFSGNLSMKQLKEEIKSLSEDYIILLLSYNLDATGRVFTYREIANHVKEVANCPVYGVWDFFFYNGCATGGCITRGFDQGAKAAQLAHRILNGEQASHIPVVSEYLTRFMVDYNRLIQFGVDQSGLPKDCIILNQPYSLYRENPTLFWKIALVILLFVLLSTGLVISLFKLLKSQKELEEGRQRLDITLNSIAEAVISTNFEGKVVRMNPIAEKLTGWSFAEAAGMKLSEIFVIKNQSDGSLCLNLIEDVFAAHEPVNFSQFNCLIDRNGKEIPISCSASPIRDDIGDVSGIVAVFRDTTEESIIQEKLRHSQKMDAVGQLAGGVAHDFNNALSGIIGAVQLLQNEKTTEYSKKILKLIEKSADRAADLTAKLLAFSRKSRVDSAPQDFHAIVQASIDILSRTIDPRILLQKSLDAEDSIVSANFSELESVLLNLGINASHAMPDGGELSFTTRNVVLDDSYCQASSFALVSGKYLMIEVADTGIGIPPENLTRIFEPFFTTKEQGKGTGLGLSAAYGTIVQHKGAINVYSEPGRGTTFRIYFPTIDETAEVDNSNDELIRGTGTILLIDDEPAVRFTNRLLLENVGYRVLLAENGVEGLEIYKKNKDEIDLVILDMIMPEMNGSECFDHLKEIDPEVKVVLCSGFPQDADVTEMKKAGLISFLYKPCRSEELSRVVAAAIGKQVKGRKD